MDTKGQILYDSSYMRYIEQLNSQRQQVEQWLPGTGEEKNGELLLNRNRTSAGEDEKVLEMVSGDSYTTI